MKIKIIEGTVLHEKLKAFKVKCQQANQMAKELALSIPGVSQWHISHDAIAGGLTAVRFKDRSFITKNLFRLAFPSKSKDAFFPKDVKENAVLLAKIKSLPVVTRAEVARILGYEPQMLEKAGVDYFSFSPGLSLGEKHFLVEIPEEATFKLIAGMKEITKSEFLKLSGENEAIIEKKNKKSKQPA